MAIFPLDDILTTFKDGISRALRVKSETSITGGYSPANTILQNAATATGNGTIMDVNDYATVMLDVSGTFVGTINFEGSINDTNWYPLLAVKRGDGTIANNTTTTGLYEINVSAVKSIRARISSYTSGSITVIGKASPLVTTEKAVQLTGRNIEEIIPVNAVAITDTNYKYYSSDISKYKGIYVVAKSSLDQSIDIYLGLGDSSTLSIYTGSAWDTTQHKITIPANNLAWFLINTKATWLNDLLFKGAIWFILKANTAPTSGSITIKVWGATN